jgi:type 1 glutamine amidotransferase
MAGENDQRQAELVAWLTHRGHSPEEIAKILQRVAEYDAQTVSESIFDSIDKGDFNLAALIEEALGRSGQVD